MKKAKPKKAPKKAARKKKPRRPPPEAGDLITELIDDAEHEAAHPAPEPRRSLGERIRGARELRELTLEDLSSRTGISTETLERMEANEATPPLGQLVRLGKALEMKMGYFISSGFDRPMSIVRADSRPKVARRSQKTSEQYGYVYESLAAEKSHRLMEPFLVTLVPTEFGEESSHDGQEFIFVLEGRVRAKVGEEVEILRPGDSIYYDSSTPHLVKCEGKAPAKILAVIYAGER
jgi:quercetin dioxygenase-like cupin family protein